MMEAMTTLAEIDVAEASSHLFHAIMQAPISPTFPYFCKQRASCLAIYCAYQWKDALPRVKDPQDIFAFLDDYFMSQLTNRHQVHGKFLRVALVVLVHAYDSTPIEVLKYINSSSFIDGISDLFHHNTPLPLRRAALLSLGLIGDKEFETTGWNQDEHTRKRFFEDCASTVNSIDHTPDIWKAILMVFLRMINSKHWFLFISSEKLKFLGHIASAPKDSQSLSSHLNQTDLMNRIRSLGDLAVTANWLIILWLNL